MNGWTTLPVNWTVLVDTYTTAWVGRYYEALFNPLTGQQDQQGEQMRATTLRRTVEEQQRFEALEEAREDRELTDPEVAEYTLLEGLQAPIPVPRTAEQEMRYLYLSSRVTDGVSNNEENYEHNRLSNLGNYDGPPLKKRINVKVAKAAHVRGGWEIRVRVNYNNVGMPPWNVIKGLIPVQHHQFLPTGRINDYSILYKLGEALNNGLPAAILHEALKGWIMAVERQQPVVESEGGLDDETAELLRAMPAELNVGGKIYKLIPAGEADVSPLIKRVRKRALAGAKAESLAIVQRANNDASIVVNQATQRRSMINEEIDRARREANISNPVPEWVKASSRAHKWLPREGCWHVELSFECVISEIRLTVRHWNRILFWNPVTFNNLGMHRYKVWLKLRPANQGAFTLDDVYNKEYPITHIADRCCMDLQGLPTAINSNDSARALENALGRGVSQVNLNSPLYTGVDSYWEDFKDQLPEGVKEYLRGNFSVSIPNPNRTRTGEGFISFRTWMDTYHARATWNRVSLIEEEANETFTVGDPRLLAIPTTGTPANTVTGVAAANDNIILENGLALAAGAAGDDHPVRRNNG